MLDQDQVTSTLAWRDEPPPCTRCPAVGSRPCTRLGNSSISFGEVAPCQLPAARQRTSLYPHRQRCVRAWFSDLEVPLPRSRRHAPPPTSSSSSTATTLIPSTTAPPRPSPMTCVLRVHWEFAIHPCATGAGETSCSSSRRSCTPSRWARDPFRSGRALAAGRDGSLCSSSRHEH